MFATQTQDADPYEAMRAKLGIDRVIDGRRMLFAERIGCWAITRAQVAALDPPPQPSVKVCFDPARWPPTPSALAGGAVPDIRVEDADTIDCALALAAVGLNPVALNLADDCMPGGCVGLGSGAQEESLFRRTSLCGTLDHSMYPILDDEGIYSPGVAVLKTSEADGWRCMSVLAPSAQPLAFMTVPGIKYPACDYAADPDDPRLKPEDAQRLAVKVRLMLQIARDNGHDAIVLGASGCGAWKCPPRHVAEVFRDVLREGRGAVRVVTFAILRTPVSGERTTDNYDVFCSAMAPGHV